MLGACRVAVNRNHARLGPRRAGHTFRSRRPVGMLVVMFEVRLTSFSGPLDLLVTLVDRGELDISAVALVEVTGQYLDQLRCTEQLDPDLLAEFAAAAARLIYLKSLALLPRPPAPPSEAIEEDPTVRLAAFMREYERFKAVALEFRGREDEGLRSYPRLVPAPALPPGPGLSNVTLDRLVALVQEVLCRRPPEPAGHVPVVTVTVRQRLAALAAVLGRAGRVSFRAFIGEARSRVEVIVSFMAVLELIKGGRAAAMQVEAFGDIEIVACSPVVAGLTETMGDGDLTAAN